MNVALTDAFLPVRLRCERPLMDDELFDFCVRNETLRVERDSNGELILMSPTGLERSNWNSVVNFYLMLWAQQFGTGKVFDATAGFTLPDGLTELQDKMKMWIASGVDLAWLSDPKRRVVEVYRSGEEPESTRRVRGAPSVP